MEKIRKNHEYYHYEFKDERNIFTCVLIQSFRFSVFARARSVATLLTTVWFVRSVVLCLISLILLMSHRQMQLRHA